MISIAEVGHFALILALGVALYQFVVPLWGAQRGDVAAMRDSRISFLYSSVQRWSPIPAPARLTTASTPSSPAGSKSPLSGFQYSSSRWAAARRTIRTTR
jgi:hypothetical protein